MRRFSSLPIPPFLAFVAFSALAASSALGSSAASPPTAPPTSTPAPDLWALAQRHRAVHRFSTLFTAQNVREYLSSDAGLRDAIDWCKRTAVTKVYIEEFRGGYTADRATLIKARDAFGAAGIEASGCITTTRVGKDSTGWKEISCYTDPQTQEKLKSVFEYAAGLFNEIMIDDFWFTDCECPECKAARAARVVTIGGARYPVAGDTWEDYRCELMVQLSRHYILEAARKVNPKVKIIIKYPQWYDQFHERGYDVARETADFDRIWVGTETRDYTNKQWGGTVQFEGFFIMRWLGGLGGAKCGGGWFDPYGTSPATYLEQARQTVLAGARESMLFCYGSLQSGHRPEEHRGPARQHPRAASPSPAKWRGAAPPALPPTSLPAATPTARKSSSISSACSVCRSFPATSSRPRRRRRSSRSMPSRTPTSPPNSRRSSKRASRCC